MKRVPAWGGTGDTEAPPTDDEITDQYLARKIEATDYSDDEAAEFYADPANRSIVGKRGLSPAFGRPDRRRAQLVARLKRRRKYANPVKGGTGRHKRKGGKGHFG